MRWMVSTAIVVLLASCASCRTGAEKPPTKGAAESMTVAENVSESSDSTHSNDVCGFSEPVPLGAPDNDGMVRVPPAHPDIRYGGRIDCTDPEALRFSHVGVTVKMGFTGSKVGMQLTDFGISKQPNYYTIVIDDGVPRPLEVSPGEHFYLLADNLGDGRHTIEVFKRTENGTDYQHNNGKGIFSGFFIPKAGSVHSLAAKRRRVAFIGDSVTCGYGNGIATAYPDKHPYTSANQDAYFAYGAVAARILDASYMAVAYSGRGMVRNYSGVEGKTIPQMYLDILPDDPQPGRWDPKRYTPDLVVINLGTNDFSVGISETDAPALRERFTEAYAQFLETLRDYYPEAVFILGVGPMLSDEWPVGVNALTSVKTALETVLAGRRSVGDEKVHILEHEPQRSPFGEDWHPTAARHRIMADELLRRIDALKVFQGL